jgi:hypothetical protein
VEAGWEAALLQNTFHSSCYPFRQCINNTFNTKFCVQHNLFSMLANLFSMLACTIAKHGPWSVQSLTRQKVTPEKLCWEFCLLFSYLLNCDLCIHLWFICEHSISISTHICFSSTSGVCYTNGQWQPFLLIFLYFPFFQNQMHVL